MASILFMSSTEITSSTDQLVAVSNARIFSIGWIWSPLKDFTAKIAQTLGLEYGTSLSPNDQAAIYQYYRSRGQIATIMPEVTKKSTKIAQAPAANDSFNSDSIKEAA